MLLLKFKKKYYHQKQSKTQLLAFSEHWLLAFKIPVYLEKEHAPDHF
jgi:hypothetical protein